VWTQSIAQDLGKNCAFKGSLPNELDKHERYDSRIFLFGFIACRITQILDLLQEVEQEEYRIWSGCSSKVRCL
jgi:hypothetical protein